jgi:hypothetical protein
MPGSRQGGFDVAAEILIRVNDEAEARGERGMLNIRSAQRLAWGSKIDNGFNTTDVPLEFCLLQGETAEVSRPERPEGLIVVYDGGVLTREDIDAIVVQDGELAGCAFVRPDEVAGRVTPLVARRVSACLEALAAGAVATLEAGSPAD